MKENAKQTLTTLLARGQVFTDSTSLISYEVDAGLDRGMPEGVVFPRSTDDVVRLVHWAAEYFVPLVARGAGTGLSGGAVADRGGVIVEFSRMNAILDIDAYGRSVVAQPAVINLVLDEQVKAHGLYFPPDPASQRASTIGGNVSENSGGPHCFKYGVTTNYITGMHVVLADGRSVRIGGRALDYPAYDLCGLMTGSEGMFGLMTEIYARLVRNPPAVKTMLAVFDSVEQAGIAVSAIIAAGLVPATLEMMDQKIISIVEPYAHANLPLDAGAALIIEVDGYPASLDSQIEEIATLVAANSGRGLRIARDEEERAAIWLARKSSAGAIARLAPASYTVDITVPRSQLAAMLAEVNAICDRYDLRVGYVFHAGDGNLHPLILIPDPRDPELIGRVHRAGWETVAAAVQRGGSLSGEHGVGIEKREFMSTMHTPAELAAMLDIKHAFDPHNLLNPGKIFPLPDTNQSYAALDVGAQLIAPLHPSPHNYGLHPSASIHNDTAPVQALLTDNVFTPTSAFQAAEGLTVFSAARKRVHISSASRLDAAHSAAMLLSTTALKGISTYAPEDMYITVGAGTLLSEIQGYLKADAKWLPLASPRPTATIGGLVAANANAPLRMRYGAIRDLVLCATVALADGRVIRTGRPVIKNVAGYDLTKVFIGSHGTLGLLTDITLKFVVPPRSRRTLLVPIDDLRSGLRYARKLLPLALVASGLVLCNGHTIAGVPRSSYLLAYTAEGIPEDVHAELDEVREMLRAAGAPPPIELQSRSATDIWSGMLRNAATKGMLQLRIGLPAKDVPAFANDHAALLDASDLLIDIANGMIYAAYSTHADDLEATSAWVEQLRRPALALDGYAIVMDMPESMRDAVERWGYKPETLDIMRGLKAQWDPQGILNAGEFIL
jgi:glycolate oxidase subunit GlcD